MPVYILHLSELAVSHCDCAEIIAGGGARVLEALPPRRRAALFGRALPFRIIVVNEDCCPVLFIPAEMVAVFAGQPSLLKVAPTGISTKGEGAADHRATKPVNADLRLDPAIAK